MRLYMTVAVLLGWLALLLQLYLMVAQSPAGALAIAATIVSFFSFFTILSNFIVTLTLTFALWGANSTGGAFFPGPRCKRRRWYISQSLECRTACCCVIYGTRRARKSLPMCCCTI